MKKSKNDKVKDFSDLLDSLTNTDDKQFLDAMSGLWCVNVGYGRKNLAEVAYKQMQELPYYNSFFKTATAPSIELAQQLAEIAPNDLNHAFFSSSGSEANASDDSTVNKIQAELGSVTGSLSIGMKF